MMWETVKHLGMILVYAIIAVLILSLIFSTIETFKEESFKKDNKKIIIEMQETIKMVKHSKSISDVDRVELLNKLDDMEKLIK